MFRGNRNEYWQNVVDNNLNPAMQGASIWDIEDEGQGSSDAKDTPQKPEVNIYYGAIEISDDFVKSFEELSLPINIMDGIKQCFYGRPPILVQKYLSHILNKKYDDIVIHAGRKTGKTTSALIAVLKCLAESTDGDTKSVIICPNCESAKKLVDIGERLARFSSKFSFCLLKRKQKDHKNLDITKRIIVGTPEKICNVVDKGLINIGKVKVMVIDEVDMMLTNQGHLNSLSKVCQSFPKSSRIIMLNSLDEDQFKNVFKKISWWTERPCPLVIQFFLDVSYIDTATNRVFVSCEDERKRILLEKIVFERSAEQMIIVCQSTSTVVEITSNLQSNGYSVDSWYGKLAPTKREAIMKAFKSSKTRILVSTPLNADMFQHRVSTIVCFDEFIDQDEFLLQTEEYRKFSANLTKSPSSLLVNFINERDKHYLSCQLANTRIIDETELITKLICMRGYFDQDISFREN